MSMVIDIVIFEEVYCRTINDIEHWTIRVSSQQAAQTLKPSTRASAKLFHEHGIDGCRSERADKCRRHVAAC
jgi:hypothetical protein